MRLRTCLWLTLILAWQSAMASSPVPADSLRQKGLSYSLSYEGGTVIKHTPKLTFDVPDHTWGASFELRKQLYGRQPWQAWQHFPQPGVLVQFFEFGDPAVLGRVISVAPSLSLNLFSSRYVRAQFQLASGIGWLNQPYHATRNLRNNAYSTHLNNMTRFALHTRLRLTDRWAAQLGGTFTHFSNGGSSLPNYGINIGSWSAGVQYTPNAVRKHEYIDGGPATLPKRRIGVQVQTGYAQQESMIPDGPAYPMYQIQLVATWHHRPAGRWMIGTGYEYVTYIRRFGEHIGSLTDPVEARKNATRKTITVGHESLLGPYSIVLQLGTYYGQYTLLPPEAFFEKLSARRYFLTRQSRNTGGGHLFAGVTIKAHRFTADYISAEFGVCF